MLDDLITALHQQIVVRARRKTTARSIRRCNAPELDRGISLLLDQIVDVLRASSSGTSMLNESAAKQGRELCRMGFSMSQVVHSYGDICQAVTELAIEINTPVATDDFRVFSRCLDEAIASALAEYEQQRDAELSITSAENLGMFVRDLDHPLCSALSALAGFKQGSLVLHTNAGSLLERSLRLLLSLVDRPFVEMPQEPGRGASFVA